MLTAAVLLYDGCTIAECIEAATRLRNNGVDVSWLSTAAADIEDQSGLSLTPTRGISDIEASSLSLLIIPGGDPGSVIGNETVQRLAQQVAASGVVAGICAGVLILADAGILAGHRVTHNYRSPWAPPEVEQQVIDMFSGSTIEPDRAVGVVTDRRVITALPNATAEFSVAVCRAANVYDDDHAQLLVRHLQGRHVPALFATVDQDSPGATVSVQSASAISLTWSSCRFGCSMKTLVSMNDLPISPGPDARDDQTSRHFSLRQTPSCSFPTPVAAA